MTFNRWYDKKTKLIPLILFLLALTVRVSFAIYAKDVPPCRDDCAHYSEVAKNLVAGKGHVAYDQNRGKLQSFFPPLYPSFLALIYALFGEGFLPVQVVQIVMSSMICVFIYFIGRQVTGTTVAIISSLVTAIYPTLVAYSRVIMTETLFSFLLALWVLFVVANDERLTDIRNQAISGFLLGLMTLTRGVTLLLPLFVPLWGFFRWRNRKAVPFSLCLTVLFYALTLAPWTIRNYAIHHRFVPVATEGGELLWTFKVKLKGFVGETDYNTYLPPEWYKLPEAEWSSLAAQETLRVFLQHPIRFVKNSLIGSLALFRPFTSTVAKYDFCFGILFPLFFLGAVLFFQHQDRTSILNLIVFYPWLMAILTYGQPRFRVPFLPYYILLAVFGIMLLFRSNIKLALVVIASVVMANLLVVAFFPQIYAFVEGPFKSFLLH